MNRKVLLVMLLSLISFPMKSYSQNVSDLQNPTTKSFVYKKLTVLNPSIESQALFQYLQNISGEKILSGQMTTPQNINELEYILYNTGKQPAIRGFEFASEEANNPEIQKAINWWEKGGIALIMWDWSAPNFNQGYENSQKEIDIEKLLTEGTREYESFWKELKINADLLDTLRAANIPVLWCPFHEANGEKFWWGKQGSAKFIKLWQTMFSYFTRERKLNNLIWVQCFSNDINRAWFPGNGYVDIIATSSYAVAPEPLSKTFKKARVLANNNNTPIALNLIAAIPDPEECKETGAMWSWWMQRPDSYLTNIDNDYLNEIYYHDLIVTLNEVPDIVEYYGGETVKRFFYSGTTIPFSELKGFEIGKKSGNLSIQNDQLKIEAQGEGIKGVKDEGYFAFKQLDGDFDVSIQVIGLSQANLNTMAGIMARADLSRKSPHVFFHVFPNNNPQSNNSGGCELKYRTRNSKQTMIIYPDSNTTGDKYDVDFPNTWIRLKRRGNLFKSYISRDNINWHIYSVHAQEMPEKLLVGVAVASGSNKKSTIANFKDLEITWE